jgi:putative ABC transport system permease protein
VEKVSPVFFILAAVELSDGSASLYLTGYDPSLARGGPPGIIEGRNVETDNEIVLDRSFAGKHKLNIGNAVKIRDDTLRVVGLSTGTNMFVIQYAFITLQQAYKIIGIEDLVSCFQIEVKEEANIPALVDSIEQTMPTVVVFDQKTFLQNNIHEMESGILPLLFFVAVIGAVVLTAVLSLILSINVLERRKDFAVMKALGSPRGFISKMVIVQSLLLAGSGLLIGIGCFFPLMKLVEQIAPEVSVLTSGFNLTVVIAGVLGISLISSVLPIHKLRRIYPMEVFQ